MKNIYQFPSGEDPTAEACEWLARIDRGLTEQESQNLKEWLSGNPRRSPVLIESARLWDQMDSLSRLAHLFPKPAPHPRVATVRVGYALAASLLIGVIAALIPTRTPDSGLLGRAQVSVAGYTQLFETAVGEQSTIRLPDGSELTLNTHSRVTAEFRGRERRLNLERGEVYIKVAHDETRPFNVFVGDRIVRAVGTEFNVEITADQRVEVIVTEGKVLIAVNQVGQSQARAAVHALADTPVVAGQRVLLGQVEDIAAPIATDDIDVKLSWREGNLIFRGEPLSEALGEIERYTQVEFVVTDEKLKTIRVAGMFKAGDVDGLLETLRQNFNISYERQGADKILLKSE